jgi:hypothetical protein
MLLETAEFALTKRPDRALMVITGLDPARARLCAMTAAYLCRRRMPKATGAAASRIQPLWDRGYFGIAWMDSYVWFQDHGIRAFTMRSLEGKTIPMWVDDPTGQERLKNPKAKTRVTMSGKTQVLIFRKVGRRDQALTRTKTDPRTKLPVTVAATKAPSYPGAPGRISRREAGAPLTREGRKGGQISRGNIGVRWRHPGLEPRLFINNSLTLSAQLHGIMPLRIYLADERWRAILR